MGAGGNEVVREGGHILERRRAWARRVVVMPTLGRAQSSAAVAQCLAATFVGLLDRVLL